MVHLSDLIARGGKHLLDMSIRNKAIRAINLRSMMKPDDKRTLWPYIAENLICHHSPSNKEFSSLAEIDPRTSVLLQAWKISMAKNSKLPRIIKECIKIAQELNLYLDPEKLNNQIRSKMPIWLHPGKRAGVRYSTNHLTC
ncbi:hypothetical protein AN958_00802 [Leucoagaricus sp. SymC.cos]|nr:hypothetical protein AN958_00802 [Leucoagaricus sp. SymC.cos]